MLFIAFDSKKTAETTEGQYGFGLCELFYFIKYRKQHPMWIYWKWVNSMGKEKKAEKLKPISVTCQDPWHLIRWDVKPWIWNFNRFFSRYSSAVAQFRWVQKVCACFICSIFDFRWENPSFPWPKTNICANRKRTKKCPSFGDFFRDNFR